MEKLIIKGGRLVFPGSIESGLALVCDKSAGKILGIVRENDLTTESTDEVIDAAGSYVSPGFVDIHVHGGGGYDFMDGTVEAFLGASRMHAIHGTTSMIPTTVTSTDEDLYGTFNVFDKACSLNEDGAQMLGLHLEGPYFSAAKSGAQDPSYLKNPSPDHYMPILDATDSILRWSVAPELPGAMALGDELSRRGILAALAHTDAVYETVEESVLHGYSHVTHLYCAMSTIIRKNAYRYAGLQEAAFLLDDLSVEIIADGVHLPKSLLQYTFKFKGADKTALCTDAMRAAGMPEGTYILGSLKNGQNVIVEDGVAKLPDRSAFAGSVATTDRLVRTMVQLAGVSLVDAVKMMTLTPSRIMRIDDRKGSLLSGKDADIVIFDDNIDISATIRGGKTIYKKIKLTENQ